MAGNDNSFPPWPVFGQAERQAVDAVLEGGRLDYWRGGEVRAFERAFADYCQVPHAVAVSSGTAALEVTLHSLGIGPGDEVVVPARSFVATASSVVMCGARPVFADVAPASLNIDADTIAQALTPATRAVICVHLAGLPCEMDPIVTLARHHKLRLIEDCAQAHGAEYRGRRVGSFGDAAAFSFCQDKIITTGGEGGMVLTGDEQVRRRAWSFKDHGKDVDGAAPASGPPVYRWIHNSAGTNLRMTELQGAIGRVQLDRLDQWLATRRANGAYLDAAFAGLAGVRVLTPPAHVVHARYKYYLVLDPDLAGRREAILASINRAGVPCLQGVCPEIYREAAFREYWPDAGRRLPVAASVGQRTLMFQIHPGIDRRHLERTAHAVREALAGQ